MAGIAPIGIRPLRRSMARLPAPGGRDVNRWPMLLGAGERWYAKPDAGKLIVSPAEEDPTEPQDAWADDMVVAEGAIGAGQAEPLGERAFAARWRTGDGGRLTVVANLDDSPGPPFAAPDAPLLYATHPPDESCAALPPWSVAWYLAPGGSAP